MTKLSIIIEWANTELNTVTRAWDVLQELAGQWRILRDGTFAKTLGVAERDFLAKIEAPAELIIASGQHLSRTSLERLWQIAAKDFDLKVVVEEGAEYYPLKNYGARASSGDLLLFLDSDVLPDPDWLTTLLSSFAKPMVYAVAAQTYVEPFDLWSKAFAVGWIYDLPDPVAGLIVPRKVHANTLALYRKDFEGVGGFPSIGRRSRGAGSQIQQRLKLMGIEIWENRSARVQHPPPQNLSHLAIRALSQGRDHVFRFRGKRVLAGLFGACIQAAIRFTRGVKCCWNERHKAFIRPWEIPGVIAIIAMYYGLCVVGAVLTCLVPQEMARSFRI